MHRRILLSFLVLLCLTPVVFAQDGAQPQVTFESTELATGIYMIEGVGGFGGGLLLEPPREHHLAQEVDALLLREAEEVLGLAERAPVGGRRRHLVRSGHGVGGSFSHPVLLVDRLYSRSVGSSTPQPAARPATRARSSSTCSRAW